MSTRKIIIISVAAVLVAAFIFFNTGKYINSRINEIQKENMAKFDSINRSIMSDKQIYDSTGNLITKAGEQGQNGLGAISSHSDDTSGVSGNMAALYIELGMYDKAIPELRKAVAVDREFVYSLAYAFEKNNQIDSAKFYYREFLKIDPNAKDVRLRLDSLTSLNKKSR